MEATQDNSGGLIGAFKNIGTHARGVASFVSNPDRVAIYLVLFAGFVTILKKNGVNIPDYMMLFGVSLGVAALLYEMSASRAMARAFWNGRAFSTLTNGLIWAVAFGFSVNNWLGAASEGQVEKTNVHKAAFLATADTRKAVTDLEKQIDIKTKSLDWSKALDSPDSYEARITAAKEDAAYEATRGGCRSKCIAKQQLAASLEADRQNAINRAVVQEELKVLAGKLEDARKVAANTKVETSETRNDLIFLTAYAGFGEDTAQLFNGLFSIIVVSIFLSFGSMRDEFAKLQLEGPRTPFEFIGRAYRWVYRLLTGKQAPASSKVVNTTNIITDVRGALATVEALKSRYEPKGSLA